jgi:hypothetical protein
MMWKQRGRVVQGVGEEEARGGEVGWHEADEGEEVEEEKREESRRYSLREFLKLSSLD